MLRRNFFRIIIERLTLFILFVSIFCIPSLIYSQEEDYETGYYKVKYLEGKVDIIRRTDGFIEESGTDEPMNLQKKKKTFDNVPPLVIWTGNFFVSVSTGSFTLL